MSFHCSGSGYFTSELYNAPSVPFVYPQVVWKATTAVGVAQAAVGSGSSRQIFIVARYRPRGNVLRIFKENVGNKRASGTVPTTANPSLISIQSTTLLPPTARPSLTSAGVHVILYKCRISFSRGLKTSAQF